MTSGRFLLRSEGYRQWSEAATAASVVLVGRDEASANFEAVILNASASGDSGVQLPSVAECDEQSLLGKQLLAVEKRHAGA